MKLSKTDKSILESYFSVMEGLAEYLGSAYEFTLHSLEDYNHSVIRIINGYHSGRTIGAPITDLALNMLQRIENGNEEIHEFTSYQAINGSGERVKSSTIPIYGEKKNLIGLLCINLYLDTPLSEILQSITAAEPASNEAEHFANNINDIVAKAVSDARNIVLRQKDIPAINRNRELIRILQEKGIFNVKDSVALVADTLGISRNTVYLHLRSIDAKNDR